MPSVLIGYFIAGLAVLAFTYLLLYPNVKGRFGTTYILKNPAYKKTFLHDEKYGFCLIKGGKRLTDNSYQLELEDQHGDTHMPKFYHGDIMPWNEFNVLVGGGAPVYITKNAFYKKSDFDSKDLSQIQQLRNELEKTKTEAKIFINNPKETIREIADIIGTIEGQKQKKETIIK